MALLAGCGSTHLPGPTTVSAPTTLQSTITATTTASTTAPTVAAPAAWTTYHRDAGRTGVDPSSPPFSTLTRAWAVSLDGAIYAEPLVVGTMVVVATENDTVYGFDMTSGALRWRTHLGPPVAGSRLPCGDIDPSGITGTPVADPAHGGVWVVAFLSDGAGLGHQLVELDLATGAVRSRRAADVAGTDATLEQQRSALALDDGSVVVAYGGLFGDCGDFHGEVVVFPTSGTGSVRSWVVPTASEGGIWSPPGPVQDGSGNLFVTTGNGASRSVFDDANAVVRLLPSLAVADVFAPSNWAQLSASDQDLGSTSPTLVDGRVLAVGKDGMAYLLDAGHLGGVGGQLAVRSVCSGSGAFGGTAVSGSVAFVPCRSGLVAVEVASGLSVRWSAGGSRPGSPVLAGGVLWVVDADGSLQGLDPATGRVRTQVSVGHVPTSFPTLAAADGRLFVPVGSQLVSFVGV
jgi:outer membrane protein assembly factor BamB